MSTTIGEHLAATLARMGATTIVGVMPPSGLDSLAHLPCADPDLACLLADADGRVNGGYGIAMIEGSILHVSSRPGGTSLVYSVTAIDEAVQILATLEAQGGFGTVAMHLDLDLAAPLGDVAQPDIEREMLYTLDPALRTAVVAIVAGPGVWREAGLEGLLSVATAAGSPVVNTWGAKGIFRWDSPFHGGTAGLQADDWRLAGLDDADLVIATGLDPDEVDAVALGSVATQEIRPSQLAALLAGWPPTQSLRDRPPLYEALASVIRPLYEDDRVLNGARASLHLSGGCPDSGVIVGDVDMAGFWLARSFPTGIPGSVVVPGHRLDGFAAAGALMAAHDGRPSLAVTGEWNDTTAEICGLGRSLGHPVPLQWWRQSDSTTMGSEHVELSLAQLDGSSVEIVEIELNLDVTALIDVAGPIDRRFAGE